MGKQGEDFFLGDGTEEGVEGKVVEGGNESLVEIADSGAIYGVKGFGKVTENGNDELDVGGGCDVKGSRWR